MAQPESVGADIRSTVQSRLREAGGVSSTKLPGAARMLIASNMVSSLGTGPVLPLTLICLHGVRGFALPVVGVLLTMSAAVGLAAVPLSGVMTDRFGLIVLRAVQLLRRSRALMVMGLIWAGQ
jgi:hypothetical protein